MTTMRPVPHVVFTRSGGVRSQQAKLVGTGAERAPHSEDGLSCSGDGNIANVGGPNDKNRRGPT